MWFGNLNTSTELQGFHYSQGKNTKCGITIFSLKNNIKTLISKTTIFISCTHDSQWAMASFHGLSLRKSPIKNYNNIISDWVIIQIKHNQAPQSPTTLIFQNPSNAQSCLSKLVSHTKWKLTLQYKFKIVLFGQIFCEILLLNKNNLYLNGSYKQVKASSLKLGLCIKPAYLAKLT